MFNWLQKKIVTPALQEAQARTVAVLDDITHELVRIEETWIKDVTEARQHYERWLGEQLKELREQVDSYRLLLLEARTNAQESKRLEDLNRGNLSSEVRNLAKDILTTQERLANIESSIVPVAFKKTCESAKAPTKAYKEDAGWDVYSIEEVFIPKGSQREVKIGLAFETPVGYHIQIHTRSSHGKKMLRCHLGIVDSGYRNELSIWMQNLGEDNYVVKAGDKVCQLLFLPVPNIEMKEVKELNSSERGVRGHGSSGR